MHQARDRFDINYARARHWARNGLSSQLEWVRVSSSTTQTGAGIAEGVVGRRPSAALQPFIGFAQSSTGEDDARRRTRRTCRAALGGESGHGEIATNVGRSR